MKHKWWHWLERENIPILYGILRHRSHPFRKEFKDFTTTYLRLFFAWDKNITHVYWRQEDLDNFNGFFIEEIKKQTDFMKKVEEFHFSRAKSLIEFSSNFLETKFLEKSNEELYDYFTKYEELYSGLTLYSCLGIIGSFAIENVIEPYLRRKLKEVSKEEKYGEYLSLLTHHGGKSWKRLEEEDLLKIAEEAKKTSVECPRITLLLDKHVKDYCWLELGYQFLGKPLSKEEFTLRLNKLIKFGLPGLPKKEEIVEKQRKIVEELNIDREHVLLFSALGKLIYLKEYRDGIYCRTQYELGFLIKEILRRFSLSKEAGWYMVPQDYKQLLSTGKIDLNEIEKRKKLFVWIYDDEEKMLTGEEAKKIINEEVGELGVKGELSDQIRGNVASPGYAKGIAKIVKNESELYKVEEGDVLVAYMTKPSYLPAMRKASAFVTNEGGITCHAAIVSREMKKPCLIGTKIATKVLKDGDKVEVDANKGIVRKLK